MSKINFERAKQMLSMILARFILPEEMPQDTVTYLDPGAPIRSKGKGKMAPGVDRPSNAGQSCYAHKSTHPHHCGSVVGLPLKGVHRCCAFHYKLWQSGNPGNGRYVAEEWRVLKDDDFVCGRPLFRRYLSPVNDDRFMIEDNYHSRFVLTLDDQVVKGSPFDCLIDAQRKVSQHLRSLQQDAQSYDDKYGGLARTRSSLEADQRRGLS